MNPFNIGLGTNVIKLTDVGINIVNDPLLEIEIINFYKNGNTFFENNDNSLTLTKDGDYFQKAMRKRFQSELNFHINIGENSPTGKPKKQINNFNLIFKPTYTIFNN